MDRGRYIDFNNPDIPNTIWNFVEDEEGSFVFREYHANHVRLGDSDSVYCTLEDLNLSTDKAVSVADEIRDFINDSYPEFVKFAFNCPDDRTHHVESNREIVSDATFVVSKKRYAAHVVNDEGEEVDKIKIMGLETKRSDTPTAVQKFLLEVIEMILEGKSEEEVKHRVSEMKEEYKSLPIDDIARPMSCKGLHVYEKKLEETGSTLGFPYQVRAAMFYNSLCGPMDQKINAGEKILLVYIKDKRENYIAFPMDAPIPSFVSDIMIDYETQWEKAEKKINSYLTAMQWDTKSKRENKRMELFGF